MSFPARYESLCIPCGQSIERGDEITNHPKHGYIHLHCVDTADDVVYDMSESNGADFDSFTRGRSPIAVLPRGKTASDRCDKCFQIPASNGTCGCC